jgi:hypothetical protein
MPEKAVLRPIGIGASLDGGFVIDVDAGMIRA